MERWDDDGATDEITQTEVSHKHSHQGYQIARSLERLGFDGNRWLAGWESTSIIIIQYYCKFALKETD